MCFECTAETGAAPRSEWTCRCAGALSPPLISVDFDATTDTSHIYHQVDIAGLSFQWAVPQANPSFGAVAYTPVDPAAVSVPNFLRICYVTHAGPPVAPVRLLASAGTFTLVSLHVANVNIAVGDPSNPDAVHFTGLRRGVAIPGCGATGITLPNNCANAPDPCPARQVSFAGCEGIDTLQMAASTTSNNGFFCVALDSIQVQACSSDSSVSATAPYTGVDVVIA